MKIAVGCDHGGYQRKKSLVSLLLKMGHQVRDAGCDGEDSCDYPDYAKIVSEAVSLKRADRGILICGTGIGMSMVANKFSGVRAAVCWNPATAALASEHNRANVLCLPGRHVSSAVIPKIVRAWLKTPFAGGRHLRRVKKISRIEARCKRQK